MVPKINSIIRERTFTVWILPFQGQLCSLNYWTRDSNHDPLAPECDMMKYLVSNLKFRFRCWNLIVKSCSRWSLAPFARRRILGALLDGCTAFPMARGCSTHNERTWVPSPMTSWGTIDGPASSMSLYPDIEGPTAATLYCRLCVAGDACAQVATYSQVRFGQTDY